MILLIIMSGRFDGISKSLRGRMIRRHHGQWQDMTEGIIWVKLDKTREFQHRPVEKLYT